MPTDLVCDHYPPDFKRVFSFFSLVDKLFVFTVKRKLRCTLQVIQSLYINFDTSELHAEYSNDEFLREFRILSALCPLGIQLSQVDQERIQNADISSSSLQMTLDGIELSFPLFGGASPSQSTKRHKMFFTAINSYLSDQYLEIVGAAAIKMYSFTTVKKSGWPPQFKWEIIPLPVLAPLQNEFMSLASKVATFELSTHQEKEMVSSSYRSEGQRSSNSTAQQNEDCISFSNEDSIPILAVDSDLTEVPSSSVSVSLAAMGGASAVLDKLRGLEGFYRDQIVHVEAIPGRKATFEELRCNDETNTINADLLRVVGERIGVKRFYTHQAKAINHILKGSHVVVSTATSSGKSVIYNLPVLSKILEDQRATALYLFPTKALAQDQLRVLQAIICDNDNSKGGIVLPVWAMACDGDTGFTDRRDARQSANIILTNPDMLHITFLPNHKDWTRIFKNLKFVVIDESHQYRGAFGSHVACVLRRLIRICGYYGSQPQFVCCSATIANPAAHFSKLLPICSIGGTKNLAVIDSSSDGSPQGERAFVIWNPPLKYPAQTPSHKDTDTFATPPRPDRHVENPHTHSHTHNHNHTSEITEAAESTSGEVIPEEIEASSPVCETTMSREMDQIGERDRGRDNSINTYSDNGNSNSSSSSNAILDSEEADQSYAENSLTRFLNGCEDKPQTLGDPGRNCVGYHKGWNRGRNRAPKAKRDVKMAVAVPAKRSIEATKVLAKIVPDSRSLGGRMSSITEMSKLLATIVRLRVRTLAFCGVRKLVELVLKYCLQDLNSSSSSVHLAEHVASYRGGYTKEERRAIEADLFSGRLLGVTATCALELGVDIGDLDATLHLGFPRSFSSLWQQAGRAGRSGRSALSILVCHDSPVDQFFARHPLILLRSSPEPAILNPDNIHVLRGHLLCAAKEIPLNSDFCNSADEAVSSLVETQDLIVAQTWGDVAENPYMAALPVWRMHPMHRLGSSPAKDVSLRLIDPITISVVDTSLEGGGTVIDSLGYSRAFYELFEGAIYMHRAKQFLVHRLDLGTKRALSKPVKVGYYTACRNRTDVNVLKVLESSRLFKTGTVHVVSSVYGYAKIWLGTGEVFEEGECSLPNLEFETTAVWIDLPLSAKKAMDAAGLDVMASIHAVNHLLVSVSSLFAECDENDVATEHEIFPSANMTPHRLLLYDKHAGGLGVCDELYSKGLSLLQKALELLSSCVCDASAGKNVDTIGCPACLLDQRCSSYNRCLSKKGALKLLECLVELESKSEEVGEDRDFRSEDDYFPLGHLVDVAAVSASPYLTKRAEEDQAEGVLKSAIPVCTKCMANKSDASSSSFVDDTPRKLRRIQALRNARFNQTGTTKSTMTVQREWTELNHQFVSDRDL